VLPHAQVLHTLAANHCARLRNVLPLGLGRGGGGGGAAGRGLERLRVAEFIHAKVRFTFVSHLFIFFSFLGVVDAVCIIFFLYA